jgi:hypothetical protein
VVRHEVRRVSRRDVGERLHRWWVGCILYAEAHDAQVGLLRT